MDCTLQNRANLKCKPRKKAIGLVGRLNYIFLAPTPPKGTHVLQFIEEQATIVKMLLTTHVHIGLCLKK